MGGKPEFTQEIADIVCKRMSEGQSLREICRDDDMPAASTICGWASKYPEFREQYAHARELLYDYWAEETIEIADDSTNDWMKRRSTSEKGEGVEDDAVLRVDHVNRARLRIDARKWLISKLAAKKYGDKLQVGGDPDGSPIEIKWKS